MSTEVAKKSGSGYAWLVMVGFGMVMCATIGAITVMGGLFYYPVCEELGFDLSSFTLYVTLSMVFMALGMPICGKIMASGKIKLSVLMTVAVLLELVPFACMSMFTEMWMWFVAAVPIGFGLSATSTVTAAPTLGNWFHKKTGFAIGMIFTIQSIFVAVASPIFSNMIEMLGWRMSYVVLAIIAAVMALPFTIFVIRYRPEDKGMLPYGYDPNAVEEEGGAVAETGVPYKLALRSVPFVMAVLVVMMSMTISNMNVVFPTYAEVVGLGAIVGGFMVTAASLADIALNPILGTTADKFGPTKSFIGWTVVTMVSFVILYFSVNSPILAIVGAGINDVMYALCGVGLATFTMAWFGKKDYERIFSTVMMFGYLVASLGVAHHDEDLRGYRCLRERVRLRVHRLRHHHRMPAGGREAVREAAPGNRRGCRRGRPAGVSPKATCPRAGQVAFRVFRFSRKGEDEGNDLSLPSRAPGARRRPRGLPACGEVRGNP